MAKTLNITVDQRGGSYVDVLDFLEFMEAIYGSTTNAAAVLLRTTPQYADWKRTARRDTPTKSRKAG